MRAYLFRGRRLDDKRWICGAFAFFKGRAYIFDSPSGEGFGWYEVDPETVGQYTGVYDRNRQWIFEGDILNIGGLIPTVNGLYQVIYDTVNHCWALKRSEEHFHHYFTFSDLNGFAGDSEVIGNINDKPELLEVQV